MRSPPPGFDQGVLFSFVANFSEHLKKERGCCSQPTTWLTPSRCSREPAWPTKSADAERRGKLATDLLQRRGPPGHSLGESFLSLTGGCHACGWCPGRRGSFSLTQQTVFDGMTGKSATHMNEAFCFASALHGKAPGSCAELTASRAGGPPSALAHAALPSLTFPHLFSLFENLYYLEITDYLTRCVATSHRASCYHPFPPVNQA
jgi:hypothetical protein